MLGVLAFAGARLAGRPQGLARARRDARRSWPSRYRSVRCSSPPSAVARSSATKASLRARRPRSVPSHKSSAWENIPNFLSKAPLGVGLGTVGAAGGFGGKVTELVEGHGVSAETQYNVVADELGAPGLIVWVALTIYVIALVATGMRAVGDGELAIMLAGALAPFVALALEGFSGPFITSTASGPYFWLAVGMAAYWFAGPGRRALGVRKPQRDRAIENAYPVAA